MRVLLFRFLWLSPDRKMAVSIRAEFLVDAEAFGFYRFAVLLIKASMNSLKSFTVKAIGYYERWTLGSQYVRLSNML